MRSFEGNLKQFYDTKMGWSDYFMIIGTIAIFIVQICECKKACDKADALADSAMFDIMTSSNPSKKPK